MKKYCIFFLVGIIFGVTLIKSEVASWFRIYEMFQFKSFHMYGVIGSAVALAMLFTFLLKKQRSIYNETIVIKDKPKQYKANLLGGIIFGLGWALGGACPGPMYVLLGSFLPGVLILLLGALLGALVFGLVKPKLWF